MNDFLEIDEKNKLKKDALKFLNSYFPIFIPLNLFSNLAT